MRPVRYTDELIAEYTNKGYWDQNNWCDIYDRNALEFPDSLAFVDDRTRLTWSQLKEKIDNLALALNKRDFHRDDRIIIQMSNRVENVVAHLACEKAGLIRVYAALNIGEAELEQFIISTGASGAIINAQLGEKDYYGLWQGLKQKYPQLELFVVCDEELPNSISLNKLIDDPQDGDVECLKDKSIGPNEVSLVMATTGSTGLPKLVEFTANHGKYHAKNYLEKWKISKEDYCLITAFLWTGPSLAGIYGAPQVGAACLMMDNFEPLEALKLIEKEKPTYLSGFPVHLLRMVRHPEFDNYRVQTFRFMTVGGAPVPRGMFAEIEDKFQMRLLVNYGSLDSLATFANEYDAPREIRSVAVGKSLAGGEVKLLDDDGHEVPFGEIGEVHVRGPMCAGGYYRDLEKTIEAWGQLGLDGWFNMGDLGRFLDDGSLMLVGRKKDMILRGGQNIFPAEIEGLLNGHPKVLQVAIVPMPDLELGEKACAYVVPVAGQTICLEEIKEFLMEKKLAKYKLPERLEIMEALPLVGDKIDKRTLGEDIKQKLEQVS